MMYQVVKRIITRDRSGEPLGVKFVKHGRFSTFDAAFDYVAEKDDDLGAFLILDERGNVV